MDNLSFWQYVVLFVRVYVGLCWVSAVGYALAKITCLESLLDLDSMLDFKLPDVMFSRLTPSPTHEYRVEVPKTR